MLKWIIRLLGALVFAGIFGYMYLNNEFSGFEPCFKSGGLWDRESNSCVLNIENSLGEDKKEEVKIAEPFAITSLSIDKEGEISGKKTISGTATGAPFFEGSMPVKLIDSKEQIVGTFVAKSTSDWMTDKSVSFTVDVNTKNAEKGNCNLVFVKQNMETGSEEVINYPVICK